MRGMIKVLKHVYRKFMICFFNLFSGMHFFGIKRRILNLIPNISVGEKTKIVGPIWAGSVSEIVIGNNTFINRQFAVEGNGRIIIGNNVDLGPGVKVLTGGHEIGEENHRAGDGKLYSINIDDGCWVGASSIILGNTCIKKGCVVGAGTIVNKDTLENTLIVGKSGSIKKEIKDVR